VKPEIILTVEDVNKEFDGFKAITNLNFYLDRGELRVIIGPNGQVHFLRPADRADQAGHRPDRLRPLDGPHLPQ